MSANANSADGENGSIGSPSRRRNVADNKDALPTQIHSRQAQILAEPYPFVQGSLPRSLFSQSAARLRTSLHHFFNDQVTPIRLASHLAVLLVVATVLIFSQVEIPDWDVQLQSIGQPLTLSLTAEPQVSNVAPGAYLTADYVTSGESFTPDLTNSLQRAVDPLATIQHNQVNRRGAIESYIVQAGDTVLGIAARFGLAPETIQWANPSLEANPDLLRIGDSLTILPANGAVHLVSPGDTLSSIALQFQVSIDAIVDYDLNHLETINTPLTVGKELIIPGGVKPYIPRQVAAYSGPVPATAARGTGSFVWPTTGRVTQKFWGGHRGVDIGAWTGTTVKAADSGYVVSARTGWNDGYGNMVVVDHGNGYMTLYGHLNSIYVRPGENVALGKSIGTVGNTGNSTGSHLHFEIRYDGLPRNPFGFLR